MIPSPDDAPHDPEESRGDGIDDGVDDGVDDNVGVPPDTDADVAAREQMVERLDARGYVDSRATAAALRAVPRHAFVPGGNRGDAYADRPLPIGADQTISAPHMVAIVTDLLDLSSDDSVLEIGTGCGYHAAVTSEMVDGPVHSVEYVPSLAQAAEQRLARLGYDVHVRVGDGERGWPEHAPYDAAYLTCAASEIPFALVEQVRAGGRIVAPVGRNRQRLIRVSVGADGVSEREDHGGVRFVRMQG